MNTRTATKTTVLPTGGGPDRKSPVLIPKGSAVAYSVYSMHRRPDLYGMDAEIFRPERWDEDMPMNDDPTNAKWGYLPFNGGPRVCLGSMNPRPPRPPLLFLSYKYSVLTRPRSGLRSYRDCVHYCPAHTTISDDQAALHRNCPINGRGKADDDPGHVRC